MRPKLEPLGALLLLSVFAGTLTGDVTRADAKVPKAAETLQGLARIVYVDSLMGFEAATAIIPQVTGVADRDPATHAWRYTYTVRNDPTSDNSIRFFAVSPVASPPLTLNAPVRWMGTRGFDADTNAVAWGVVDAQAPPANWDSLSNYPSIYNIQPGDSATFSFVHALAPVMVTYYVQGFFYADTSAESNGPINPSVFQSSITGSVVGPGSTVDVGSTDAGGRVDLRPPMPNPARSKVSVTFYLPARVNANVSVYDVAGRRVRTLVEGVLSAGYHSVEWNGSDDVGGRVRAGVYFYRLFVDGKSVGQRRVTILR